MADFLTSTHRDHWIFTTQDLVDKARAANERAVQALREYGATRVEIQADGSLAYPQPQNGARPNRLPEPLSIEEELLIRRYYEQKIQQVCGAFSFPTKIQATAVLYFKRFYLSWSVMEHDPKHIMLTCIYISCKVEEFHVSAEELGKGIQQDHQVILKNELTLLQGLNFDLIVYTPYRALNGFILDIQRWMEAKDENTMQKIRDLQAVATALVDNILLTDCPLLFPPGQLALAALRTANLQERAIDMEKYLRGVCERQLQKHTYSELVNMLNQIKSISDASRPPIEEEVKRIDRKLKFCRNPGLQDESKKRDRKGKHKTKRATQDISPMVPATDGQE